MAKERNKISTNDFISKYRKRFGDRYDFSKAEYRGVDEDIVVICEKHGEFKMTPHDLMRGKGCPICGREVGANKKKLGVDEFVRRARKVHGDKYDYSKVKLNILSDKVVIICPIHGEFVQQAKKHLSGQGCPKCASETKSKLFSKGTEEFIRQSREKFGDKFSYDKTVYVSNNKEVIVTCPIHGDVHMLASSHLKSDTGCRLCSIVSLKEKSRGTREHFIEKAREVHGDLYDYDNFEYVNWHTPSYVTCKSHGDFLVSPCNHTTNKSGCPRCNHFKSKWENEICEFISSLGIDVEQSNRSVLKGNEIDILIPKYNIGIECDGLYWHNEQYLDKNYHLRKSMECSKNGIRLVHIFEDEWKYKSEIWKSMICNMLGITKIKYYARKCIIKEVSSKDKKEFLDKNHIQGDASSKINLGLFNDGELVSLMTFGNPRINLGGKKMEGDYELVRFCNKLDCSVIGGASKLFKHFLDMYHPNKVVSYSDKRWSIGNLYEILRFTHDHDSRPNYFYVDGIRRLNRFMFRKSVLVKEGYDESKSEHEIMMERKLYRIYDCGTMVWIWKKEDDK